MADPWDGIVDPWDVATDPWAVFSGRLGTFLSTFLLSFTLRGPSPQPRQAPSARGGAAKVDSRGTTQRPKRRGTGRNAKKTERRAAHFAPTWAKARPRRALSAWRGCHYFLENRGWKRRSRPPWIGAERPGGARGGGIKGVKKLQAAEEFSYICLDKIVEPNCQTHVWAPTNPPPRRSS